jgi:hypothetical protein
MQSALLSAEHLSLQKMIMLEGAARKWTTII